MITIDVRPARRFLSGRKGWKFRVTGGNNEPIDPRERYGNVGDIRDIWVELVSGAGPVQLVVHYPDETVTEQLR
jgi:hypothetical protein